MKPNQTKYLPTKEAAKYLQSRYGYGSTALLDHGVAEGTGPPFRRFGSGRFRLYAPADLDRWAAGRKELAAAK